MHKVYIYKATLIAVGAAFLTLGIIILCQGEIVIRPLAVISATVLILHGFGNAVHFITHGGKLGAKRKKAMLFTALTNIALGALIITLPQLSFRLAAMLLGAYLLINAVSKFTDFILSKLDGQYGHWSDFIASAFYTVFVVLLIASGISGETFLVISGVYCILFGAEMVKDFIVGIIPQKAKNSLKRKIRISLPVFVSTFMPLGTLRYINEYISVNNTLPQYAGDSSGISSPPDIEIMVHVSNNGSGRVGHLDLYLDGEVISYGNHDWSSHKIFSGLGDGVMFTADKEPYLDFSVFHDRKMVFSYGLKLTNEQLSAVREEVKKLKAQTFSWKPPYQTAVEEKGRENVKLSDYHDYCSELWNGTNAKFFKFYKGKFKNYSVLSTNCVLLTDTIIGKAGTDIICISGIASPGIYYDYLERLYVTGKSMVISKTIYDRKTMRKLKKERKSENE